MKDVHIMLTFTEMRVLIILMSTFGCFWVHYNSVVLQQCCRVECIGRFYEESTINRGAIIKRFARIPERQLTIMSEGSMSYCFIPNSFVIDISGHFLKKEPFNEELLLKNLLVAQRSSCIS